MKWEENQKNKNSEDQSICANDFLEPLHQWVSEQKHCGAKSIFLLIK